MPILLLLAQILPSILKFKDSPGSTIEKVTNAAIDVAKQITGAITPDDAIQQLQANPEKLAEFKLKMISAEQDWDKIYLEDLQNARSRDVELRRAGDKNPRANWLASLAIVIVITCLAIVVWYSSLDEYAKATISLILGRTLGWVEQIFSFEFGTTRNSKTKDDTINKLSS